MRPNRLDWIVYRFFKWWWAPIFKSDTSDVDVKRLEKAASACEDWFKAKEEEMVVRRRLILEIERD